MDDQALIEGQIRYYRDRAAEYDVTSTSPDNPFEADLERIRTALRAFAPRGRVLELAAGTGQWTGILAEFADELTVTDASDEMLAINAARHGGPHVRYAVADVFALEPTPEWDVVVFGFWLSHVPYSRFEAFWQLCAGLLRPGGRVFVADEADHGLWQEDWVDRERGIVRRPLLDGTPHHAVKVLWNPADLADRLATLGWTASLEASGPFYWGSVLPAQPGPSITSTS